MFMLLLANDSQRMFSRPVGYKRDTLERDLSFRRPSCDCLACYDSGVMSNGDGLVNGLLPDYDRNRDGRPLAGQDLPLICQCPAAYRPSGHGFRGADGPVSQGLTAELSREQVAKIHSRRLVSWQETERLMRDARMARAAGDPGAMPWFIAEVRHAVAQQLARHAPAAAQLDPSTGAASQAPRRLQPLGGVLASTLTSADPAQPGPLSPLPQPHGAAQMTTEPALPTAA